MASLPSHQPSLSYRSILMIIVVVIAAITTVTSARQQNRPPIISLGLPYSEEPGVFKLSENTPVMSLLALLRINDSDPVQCHTDNQFVGIGFVSANIFKIELQNDLDRELESQIEVKIVCTDAGIPPQSAEDGFTILVQDVNDNAPMFTMGNYSTEITEGIPIGSSVMAVTAVDRDSEENGMIYYSVPEEIKELFRIDVSTGEIFTTADIDREEVAEVTFQVVAMDAGIPPLNSMVNVTVTIADLNDNAPVLLTKEFHVRENQKPMSVVGTLRAVDLDEGKNGEIVFSKVDDSEDESSSTLPFLVKSNGKVVAAVSLDRERRSSYMMKVLVKDKGKPRRSSTATVSIIVDDVNDNAPVLISPCLGDSGMTARRRRQSGDAAEAISNPGDDGAYDVIPESGESIENITSRIFEVPGYVTIDWYCPEGDKLVYNVKGTDADMGVNQELVYSIHSLNGFGDLDERADDTLFTVDPSSGNILLRRYFRKTDDLQQLVNISVSDSGNPALTAFCALNVTFDIDVNEIVIPTSTALPGGNGDYGPSGNGGAAGVVNIALVGLISSVIALFNTWKLFL